MRFSRAPCWAVCLFLAASSALAASSWSFADASVSVHQKGEGVGGHLKDKLFPGKSLPQPIPFGASDTLKVILTTQEGKTAKRAHQAFLLLQDGTTGLDVSFPLDMKESGKAKVELTHKDLPTQFLRSTNPFDVNIVIASFGSSLGYNDCAFSIAVELDASAPVASNDKPFRYGKRPEIHHIFRPDPKSPNIVITLFFTAATLATLPVLLGSWLFLGANLNHLSKAMQAAPVPHALFYGSIVGIEGVFFLYYTTWTLFQTLPVLLAIGIVAFLSGSRALSEVQERRRAGLR